MLRDNCAALTGEGIELSGGIDAKVSAEGLGGEGSCSVLRYGDEQGEGRCELLPCVTSWAGGLSALGSGVSTRLLQSRGKTQGSSLQLLCCQAACCG